MSLQPNEVLIILFIALIILGPDHLPAAVRRLGKTLGELKKVSEGFQSEMRHAFEDESEEEAARNAEVAGYKSPAAQPESTIPDVAEIGPETEDTEETLVEAELGEPPDVTGAADLPEPPNIAIAKPVTPQDQEGSQE